MDIFTLFSLISAAAAGSSLGSHLLVSLLHSALFKQRKNFINSLYIYRRLYRLNSALCLIAGICAALVNNRPAALLLAILAASYVFNHAHLLKGLIKTCDENYQIVNLTQFQALSRLQNLIHLLQVLAVLYAVYLLALHYQPAI